MYIPVIFLFMIILLEGCGPGQNIKLAKSGLDQTKFTRCMSSGEKEKLSISRLKEECEEYAELIDSDQKNTAIAICTKRKTEEIGWTKWEIERYCTRFWRGYK